MPYLALALGLLPSFAWLVFYLHEDPHPEPKTLIAETFIIGALSTFGALFVQLALNLAGAAVGIGQYSLIAFAVFGAVEEVFKFSAAKLVTAVHWKEFDEPVDAMIYMIVAALGFAAVENVVAAVRSTDLVFEAMTLRFLGATLLHTVTSGTLGYYWARSIASGKTRLLLVGFAVATTLHVIFNYLILIYEPVVVPTIFVIVAALFVLYDFEKLKKL
ncbi:PrsW family intramembrane metalloprotease [Patescibacteria group bacterium]|nr:PrsW family intramembrane metalloprotease [Patescibacteria group bacterium]